MEAQTRKSLIFGIGMFGVLIASLLLLVIFGAGYYFLGGHVRYSLGILEILPLLSLIVGVFQGRMLLTKKQGAKIGGATGFTGFFIIFIITLVFIGDFGGELFFGLAFTNSVAGAGGGYLGQYSSQLHSPMESREASPNLQTEQSRPQREPIDQSTSLQDQGQKESSTQDLPQPQSNQFQTSREPYDHRYSSQNSQNKEAIDQQQGLPERESEGAFSSKKCPDCDEEVKENWNVCIHCGANL